MVDGAVARCCAEAAFQEGQGGAAGQPHLGASEEAGGRPQHSSASGASFLPPLLKPPASTLAAAALRFIVCGILRTLAARFQHHGGQLYPLFFGLWTFHTLSSITESSRQFNKGLFRVDFEEARVEVGAGCSLRTGASIY